MEYFNYFVFQLQEYLAFYFCTMSVQALPQIVLNLCASCNIPFEKADFLLKQIQDFYSLLKIKGGNIYIVLPQEVKTMVNKTTIVYKIYDPVSKEIKFLDTNKIKRCLALVLGEVTYFTWSSRFANREVQFSSDGARRYSDRTLKVEEVVLLPSYI